MIVRTAMILSVAAVVSANAGALKLLSLPGATSTTDYDMTSGKTIESMTFHGPAMAAVFH